MTNLRRNFRRWNRSQAKYDKAFRKYNFNKHNEDVHNWLKTFGIKLSELKQFDKNVATHLHTWMAASRNLRFDDTTPDN